MNNYRKLIYIFFVLMIAISFDKVSAKNNVCKDKNILIKCAYELSTKNEDNSKKGTKSNTENIWGIWAPTLYITKDDKSTVKTNDLGGYEGSSSHGYATSPNAKNSNSVTVHAFTKDYEKIECPTKLYLNEVRTSFYHSYVSTWIIATKKEDLGTNYDLILNKKKSCATKDVNSEVTNSETMTCYYGTDKTIMIEKNTGKIKADGVSVMEGSTWKGGRCPLYVCKSLQSMANGGGQKFYDYWVPFDNIEEAKKTLYPMYGGCEAGVSFGKYKCLVLAQHMPNVTKKAYKSKKIATKNKYNESRNVVLTFCDVVLDSYDYQGTGKICVDECLKIRNEIINIEMKTSKGECVFSDRIIALIYNILKWMKYIAPVLVIVLGMLDFIKALAAQDDDAMKKAQGKFVKRLIAAALLFLLPLLIDYVLRIFGMVNSKCNITDFFK